MPLWSPPTTPVADRVRAAHQERTGTAPQAVAIAPATWTIIGEFADNFGGVAIESIGDLSAAVAVSPRTDGTIAVQVGFGDGAPRSDSISLSELAERAAQQQPTTDNDGQTVYPQPPAGGLAARIGGIAHSMIARQLLSRDTAGADITVLCDIPESAGLGAYCAIDAATALALAGSLPELDEAPTRARLSEVCTQSTRTFGFLPAQRTRHTAALRGTGAAATIIDYADHSVTHTALPDVDGIQAFALAGPGDTDRRDAIAQVRRRERFVEEACRAFNTESLRLLPDAPQRVLDWLAAVHKVHGVQGHPALDEAAQWLRLYVEETGRAQAVARALRSGRHAEVFPLLRESQRALAAGFDLGPAGDLAELALSRGAQAARSCYAGLLPAVTAFVPARKAQSFAGGFSAEGFLVLPLRPGSPAARAD